MASWRYPGEYAFYDWTSDPDDLAELLDPVARAGQYYAADADDGSLAGFLQLKPPSEGRLELGLGLHPALTGRGLGGGFLAACLEFARTVHAPHTFVLAVATFNRRAISVYERAGFRPVRTYMHRTNGADWEFLELELVNAPGE